MTKTYLCHLDEFTISTRSTETFKWLGYFGIEARVACLEAKPFILCNRIQDCTNLQYLTKSAGDIDREDGNKFEICLSEQQNYHNELARSPYLLKLEE